MHYDLKMLKEMQHTYGEKTLQELIDIKTAEEAVEAKAEAEALEKKMAFYKTFEGKYYFCTSYGYLVVLHVTEVNRNKFTYESYCLSRSDKREQLDITHEFTKDKDYNSTDLTSSTLAEITEGEYQSVVDYFNAQTPIDVIFAKISNKG